jgi:hypothetical protein
MGQGLMKPRPAPWLLRVRPISSQALSRQTTVCKVALPVQSSVVWKDTPGIVPACVHHPHAV